MNNNSDPDTHPTNGQGLSKTRDTEAKTLRSEVASLSARLKELESAKERMESFLQQELKKKTEAMRSKDSTIKELEQKLSRKAPLESQLGEKQELLKTRDAELKTLRSEVASLKMRLNELASAKERTESFLQQELRKKTEALRAKNPAVKEFEEGSNRNFEELERKLRESEDLLKARDAQLEMLRLEATALSGQLTEKGTADEQKETVLREELGRIKEELRLKDSTIEALKEKVDRNTKLENQLLEQHELLKTRDAQLATLRSEAASLSGQLTEIGSAEAQKESFLIEELKRTKEELRIKHSAIEALEEKLDRSAELENQLLEQQQLMQARDAELETLRSEATALSGRLTEKGSAQEQKENFLQDELRRIKDELRVKDSTIEALDEKLDHNSELESQIQELQQLLKARDADVGALRSEAIALTGRLAELGSAEAQKESFLHEELRRTKEELRAKDFAIVALEEKLAQSTDSDDQIMELRELLKARDAEIEALRSAAVSRTGGEAETGSVDGEKGDSVHEELRKFKDALEAKNSAMKVMEENLDRRLYSLQSQLAEKEKLLATRNKEVEKLAADLKEKKLVLAKQEIADFQSMKRRNIWKRRFAKLRLPEKPN